MKKLLLIIFFSLNIFAASVSGLGENYEQLSREIVEIASQTNIIIASTLSLLFGLFIGFLLFKKLNLNKRDSLNQNIIKDLEDEQTNLINQINYIETQNENQIINMEAQNESQYFELEKRTLHVEKENETLIGNNQELNNKMIDLESSHVILCEELNIRANKAIEEKNTLFRQVEETIIFDISK